MIRRLGFWVLVVFFFASVVFIYFFVKNQQSTPVQPFSAIPVNVALIVQIKNPYEFIAETRDGNNFFKNIVKLPGVEFIDSGITIADTLIAANAYFKKGLNKNALTISFHEVGNKTFYPLYIIPLNGQISESGLNGALESTLSDSCIISRESYSNARIYTVAHKNKRFYYVIINKLLLGSNSKLLLQDAIRQLAGEVNLLSNTEFSEILETKGQNTPINIFIQLKQFNKLSRQVISGDYLTGLGIKDIGNWMELDLNLKNQTVLLTGFATANQFQQQFLNLFAGQTPQQVRFLGMLPSGVESFMGFALSNLSLYKQNLQKYMTDMGEKSRFETNQNTISEAFGKDTETDFQKLFDKELIFVTLSDTEHLFYIKTIGNRAASEWITGLLQNYCKKNNSQLETLKKVYAIDAGSQYPIYKMPVDYLPTRMFGPWFKGAQANYVAVYDDYIIFGDNFNTLSRTIYNQVLQKNLAYNANFIEYSNYLSSRINFFSFVSLTGSGKALDLILEKNATGYFKKNQSALANFYGVSWQFAVERNLFYNNILLRYQPSNRQKAGTVWETKLDTIIAFKPELVSNHQNREKEIFVQDAKNNIYLINYAGRILWKKQVDEPIMGEVYQVDYYKNGKLQYLFNTKSKLHMFDRNGNAVERYPVSLPATAAAALSVYDYDNRKNYRIFVPLTDNKVGLYNIDGKIISGFKFQGSDQKIIAPVQYVKDNNKDYLIITDESRIYILDRQGNVRVKPELQFKASLKNIFEYQSGNSNRPSRLVRTDVNGVVYYIYFNGKVEQKNLQQCGPSHFFNAIDVTGDRINDFVFIDGKELNVYNLTGQKTYSHTFSTEIQHSPTFYKFAANKMYMGITETEARKIYLFNSKGEIIEGFPLPGKTRFSIGFLEPGSSNYNLVVGGDEYYLYNYKLN